MKMTFLPSCWCFEYCSAFLLMRRFSNLLGLSSRSGKQVFYLGGWTGAFGSCEVEYQSSLQLSQELN